jgi:hypothetical protein
VGWGRLGDGEKAVTEGAGGTTDLDNLILLCHRHHWMVHEGNWDPTNVKAPVLN